MRRMEIRDIDRDFITMHISLGSYRDIDVEDLSKIDAIMGVEREETGDFIVNEKDKIVNLTAQGVAKVERFFRTIFFLYPTR